MKYDIVLTNGTELDCYADKHDDVLEMFIKHDIFVVRENDHPSKTTYIKSEDVSHIRFQKGDVGVVEPI